MIGALLMMGAVPAAAAEANGPFSVQLQALPAAAGGMAQYRIDKQFSGDLVASSTGLMVSAGDPAKGMAGYVAMEQVSGTLAGRTGGFALQHNGTMAAGGQQLSIQIVPGSGSGALAGISGTMTIRVSGKDHFYTLHHDLPAPP
jgi:hypothetical protein